MCTPPPPLPRKVSTLVTHCRLRPGSGAQSPGVFPFPRQGGAAHAQALPATRECSHRTLAGTFLDGFCIIFIVSLSRNLPTCFSFRQLVVANLLGTPHCHLVSVHDSAAPASLLSTRELLFFFIPTKRKLIVANLLGCRLVFVFFSTACHFTHHKSIDNVHSYLKHL